MALLNNTFLLILLSKMSGIDLKLLQENRNYLIKLLSSLGEFKEFNPKKCCEILNNINDEFFNKIGIENDDEKLKFKARVFIILKENWINFNPNYF